MVWQGEILFWSLLGGSVPLFLPPKGVCDFFAVFLDGSDRAYSLKSKRRSRNQGTKHVTVAAPTS